MFPRILLLSAVFPLAACASAPQPPAEASRRTTEPVEAEPTLEERWRAPFAVQQSGELPPRPARPEPIRIEPARSTPPPADAPAAAPVPAARAPRPAPAPPKPPTAPPQAPQRQDARTHVVGRGDTLYNIGRRYGVSPAAIRAANRLPDDTIRLGQTLVIPAS